jgi:hypothetical protein
MLQLKCALFLLCLCFFKFSPAQSEKDTAAIKTLLENESRTWRTGDVKAHAACWQVRPYGRILVSLADGRCFDVPPQAMIAPASDQMGKGGSSINTNYKFHVHGNEAWVSHDEVSIAADGQKTYSHEMRLLEKISGQWKLVGQSIHIYDPTTN